MKNKYLFLFLLFLITGCSTLNRTIIEKTDRSGFQPLTLIPDYDIYDIRIDIIRQTNEKQVNDSTTETKNSPYHSVGFYLGNGLFIDLNDNLSLLVPKLLNINGNENFMIIQNHPGSLFDSKTTYEKIDSLFVTKNGGLIKTNAKKIIDSKDSAIFIKEGLLSKYKILKSDSSITYKAGLASTKVQKSKEGYYYKTLLGKRKYKQINHEVCIGKSYIIRNNGDMIEIIAKGLFNNEYLKYRIIKSANKIYVYDRNYRGLEITKNENEIYVKRNKRNISLYSLKSTSNQILRPDQRN